MKPAVDGDRHGADAGRGGESIAHTFHAGDRRSESGRRYYYYRLADAAARFLGPQIDLNCGFTYADREMRPRVTICALVWWVALAGSGTGAGAASSPSWRVEPALAPASSAKSAFDSVSCPSTTTCGAVGWFSTGTRTAAPLAERSSGSGWSMQAVPVPRGAVSGELNGISCPSDGFCLAVGDVVIGHGLSQPLAERWDGSTWTIQRISSGAGERALTAVSCTAATACTAVGYRAVGGTQSALIERWNGTRWRLQRNRRPAGAKVVTLDAVSCPSGSWCTATGTAVSAHGRARTLAERWQGSRWSVEPTPGSVPSNLSSVSCTSRTACTAVGSSSNRALAERWNGSEWMIQHVPGPIQFLYGVSCSTKTACAAVGAYAGAARVVTLAEHWNGSNWSPQTIASPLGNAPNLLYGVACASPRACTAVGMYSSTSELPLAERYS